MRTGICNLHCCCAHKDYTFQILNIKYTCYSSSLREVDIFEDHNGQKCKSFTRAKYSYFTKTGQGVEHRSTLLLYRFVKIPGTRRCWLQLYLICKNSCDGRYIELWKIVCNVRGPRCVRFKLKISSNFEGFMIICTAVLQHVLPLHTHIHDSSNNNLLTICMAAGVASKQWLNVESTAL